MTKTFLDLSPLEHFVRQAALRLDKQGVYPSGDKLCLACEDLPECDVRRVMLDLISWGLLPLVTPDNRTDQTEPEPNYDQVDDMAPLPFRSIRPRELTSPPAASDEGERAMSFNIALYRIVEGRGSAYRSLAAVTGLSPNAIKCRVNHARNTCSSDELDPGSSEYTDSEIKYFLEYSRKSSDPAVKDWTSGLVAPRRPRPDSRSARDTQRKRA